MCSRRRTTIIVLLMIMAAAIVLRIYGLWSLVYCNPDEALWSYFLVNNAKLPMLNLDLMHSGLARVLSWDYGWPACVFYSAYVYVPDKPILIPKPTDGHMIRGNCSSEPYRWANENRPSSAAARTPPGLCHPSAAARQKLFCGQTRGTMLSRAQGRCAILPSMRAA